MTGRLQGKVAIITGAGRRKGLGEAIALRFAAEGAKLVLTDLGTPKGALLDAKNIGTSEELEAIAADVRRQGAEVLTAVCDVRVESEVASVIAAAKERFGRVDVVVNNAAVGYIMWPVQEFTLEEWDLVQQVNLRGPFLFIKHAVPLMIAQGRNENGAGGVIINIASQAAKSGFSEASAYTSSKHGLLGLTRSAAVELGRHGIRVNAVCPNHVTTGLGAAQNEKRAAFRGTDTSEVLAMRQGKIALGRVGLAADTAKACVFLASDEAAYITGEAMNVSGGEEVH
jgi:meso-butanediol dehydrogenase/(S,S)-butanediol dehydrogenase/diacetyl reductase